MKRLWFALSLVLTGCVDMVTPDQIQECRAACTPGGVMKVTATECDCAQRGVAVDVPIGGAR